MGQSVICCGLYLISQNPSLEGRREEQEQKLELRAYGPVLEVRVISQVAEPGLPYGSSQVIMMSR